MDVHEFQAKELFSQFGIDIPKGFVVESKSEIDRVLSDLNSDVIVVKAQIHAGGRGKAGGVKLAKTAGEAMSLACEMLGSVLVTNQTTKLGKVVRKIYFEQGLNIKKEYYLGAVVDRTVGKVSMILSSEGGVEIEEVAQNDPSKVKSCYIDPAVGFQDYHGRELCFGIGLDPVKIRKVTDVLRKVYNLLVAKDASQVEINPLVETDLGRFVALDAKISFDDNSLYRHSDVISLRDCDEEVPEEVEASKYGLNYVKMDGTIGCMVNGAGLAMATMDIIHYYGAEPANFLDVGGGANQKNVTEAFKIILSDKVEAVLVNIFGGIMRCDVIAGGIIDAAREVGLNVPLVVRLSGTNFELGKKLLKDSGLNIVTADSLDEAARAVVNLIR